MPIELFVPPSLAQLPAPPVLSLRPADPREFRAYQDTLRSEGLHYPTDAEIRAEVRRAIGKLYTPEQAEAALARLEAFWTCADKAEPPAPGEDAAVHELSERLSQAWPRLAQLGADRVRFTREASTIAVSLMVVGWTGLDLGYSREMGRVPLHLIDKLEEALLAIEARAGGDQGAGSAAPGLAFVELCNAAFARLRGGSVLPAKAARPPRRRPAPRASAKTSPQRGKAKAPTPSAARVEKDS